MGSATHRLVAVIVLGLGVGCDNDNDNDNDNDIDDGGCEPFVVDVVSFAPGDGAGFGADALPEILFGASTSDPDGGGTLDVVSLGNGGSITVEVGCAIVDGDGVDFVVHENVFAVRNSPTLNTEAGLVAVSADGERFVGWDCDGVVGSDDGVDGCAGMAAGGDGFDLATLAGKDGEERVDVARFVRITDRGDQACCGGGDKAGFDLDAVSVVHF